ncbi:nucleotidyltransferase family protein [Methanobacterium sp. BAmetb5]|jgi:predicted nucleotidyltransferase|uniref:nucleotidyltransferase family protein n=1 Tax=Methanobacterium sp. BAmetb5 TaxID=2025351 RepID=UPI000E8218BD|nr:nucleotidyltransferase family protein [Methanobacterium sp. BAmetb5]AXV40745.1 MAG: nucleotidyltransferase [Methanobacterium sp. BAmetb5]
MRVLDLIKEHEQEIKDKYSVTKIGVFGSYARGEEKESSDVDVLVEFDEATYHNFIELIFFLEKLLDKKVDLVTTTGLSPYMKPTVEKEVLWCE